MRINNLLTNCYQCGGCCGSIGQIKKEVVKHVSGNIGPFHIFIIVFFAEESIAPSRVSLHVVAA